MDANGLSFASSEQSAKTFHTDPKQSKRARYLCSIILETVLQRVGAVRCKHVVFSFIALWNVCPVLGVVFKLVQQSTRDAL